MTFTFIYNLLYICVSESDILGQIGYLSDIENLVSFKSSRSWSKCKVEYCMTVLPVRSITLEKMVPL